jgi:hypothetical protein
VAFSFVCGESGGRMLVLRGGIDIEVFRGLDMEDSAIGEALKVLGGARCICLQGGLSVDAVWWYVYVVVCKRSYINVTER